MAILDSILKSRDITLPTKANLVRAIISLVVMYGCESWTIKKAVTNLDSVLKTENVFVVMDFADKGLYSQRIGFSSSHIWM